MAANIKIERYKNPANVDGWAGYIEPEDRAWITYFRDDGTTKHYPHRDRNTGAVIEPDAPVRRFTIWRHEDPTGVSGTGLVAYGWVREDGRAVVRWLGDFRTETLHERGIESVHAIHAHGGRSSIHFSDVDPDEIALPRCALLNTPGAERDTILLTRASGNWSGRVLGLYGPRDHWAQVDGDLVEEAEVVCGELIEGVILDGKQRPFYEDVGGVLIGRTSVSDGNTLDSWLSTPNNPRRRREFEWWEIVELLAAKPEALIVTRTTSTCGGDPAYHFVPIGAVESTDDWAKRSQRPGEWRSLT